MQTIKLLYPKTRWPASFLKNVEGVISSVKLSNINIDFDDVEATPSDTQYG